MSSIPDLSSIFAGIKPEATPEFQELQALAISKLTEVLKQPVKSIDAELVQALYLIVRGT